MSRAETVRRLAEHDEAVCPYCHKTVYVNYLHACRTRLGLGLRCLTSALANGGAER
jgi:hypothetical protein